MALIAAHLNAEVILVMTAFMLYVHRGGEMASVLWTGTEWERDERMKARPRKPRSEKDRRDGETMDRRQNNGTKC